MAINVQDNNICDCKQQLCNKISALSGSSSKDDGDEAALFTDAVEVNKSDKYSLVPFQLNVSKKCHNKVWPVISLGRPPVDRMTTQD